jgi:aspartate racemase
MKKIGIVGGLGPESTIDYYRGIIEAFTPTYKELGYPEIVIESMDLRLFTEDAEKSAWDRIAASMAERCESLRSCGAQFGAIASNTPHKVFDRIRAGTALPLLSIVEAARDHAQQLGVGRVCLLGTGFTMKSDFFQRTFQERDITVVVPNAEEIEYIQNKIYSEVEFGIIKEETKSRFLAIIDRITDEHRVEGVVLGCTELPMLLKAEDFNLHYIDTTAVHIAAIVDRCRRED